MEKSWLDIMRRLRSCLRCFKKGEDSVVPSDTTLVLAPSNITLEPNDISDVTSPGRPMSKLGKGRGKAPSARTNKPLSQYVFPRTLQLEAAELQEDQL